jgi:hypothetical protein
MTSQEFRRRVLSHNGPGLPSEALSYAADCCVAEGRMAESAVDACVKLAGVLEGYAQSRQHPEETGTTIGVVDLPRTPESSITSAYLIRELQPWLENVRKDIFGCMAPPFSSYEEALVWAQRTAPAWLLQAHSPRAQEPAPHVATAGWSEEKWKRVDVEKKAREWIEKRPYWQLMEMLDDVRLHTSARGWAWENYALHNGEPALVFLERASRTMGQKTGFSQDDLVIYILLGIEPSLPPARIRRHSGNTALPTGRPFNRRYVTIEVYSHDVTPPQLRELHSTIRAFLNIAKGKPLTEKDQRLFEIVRHLGGPPPQIEKRFWERVQQLYNGEPAVIRYTTWRGPQIAFQRLQAKLQRYGIQL